MLRLTDGETRPSSGGSRRWPAWRADRLHARAILLREQQFGASLEVADLP
jgi:hypothetical protein